MPTRRRRHAITETPPVQAALDELRQALGGDRVELAELVVLGANEKLARLRSHAQAQQAFRHRLAENIRARRLPVDPGSADEVRRTGWSRG